MKVIIYSAQNFIISYLEKANKGRHKLTFVAEALTPETAVKAVGFDVVSIFSADTASNLVLEKLKASGVKYITLRSVGYDNVDLNSAMRLGIKIAHVPAYSPYAIAEYAVSLLLAINRRLILSNYRVKQFNFDINNLTGFDLNNKTVGIVGTGKIGSVMTKIMHGFGCKLLGYDIEEDKSLIANYNMQYVSLKGLCKRADIISLHIPLNTQTHYLINDDLIKHMKQGVILINTSRGAVMNTAHVIKALENKTIAALGIDVYEHEKGVFFRDCSQNPPKDEMLIKLMAMPNVLITSHHAFLTEEALGNIAETTFYNINCWSNNGDTENELT